MKIFINFYTMFRATVRTSEYLFVFVFRAARQHKKGNRKGLEANREKVNKSGRNTFHKSYPRLSTAPAAFEFVFDFFGQCSL